MKEAQATTRTLTRGLRILEALLRAERPLRLTDVAARVDLNLNTTGRLLNTLEAEGFATRTPDGLYEAGSKTTLAAARRLNVLGLSSLARPILTQLRDEVGETTMLVTRAGDELVVLDVVEGRHELRVVLSAGLVAPLLPAATGWVLLGDDSADDVLALQKRLGPSRSDESPAAIAATLDQIRRDGILVRHSLPNDAGTCTLAALIRSHGVIVASIGIAGPSRRWNEATIEPHLPFIHAAAGQLSALLSADAHDAERRARLVSVAAAAEARR